MSNDNHRFFQLHSKYLLEIFFLKHPRQWLATFLARSRQGSLAITGFDDASLVKMVNYDFSQEGLCPKVDGKRSMQIGFRLDIVQPGDHRPKVVLGLANPFIKNYSNASVAILPHEKTFYCDSKSGKIYLIDVLTVSAASSQLGTRWIMDALMYLAAGRLVLY